MRGVVWVLMLLIPRRCFGDGVYITLNMDINGDHSRFIVMSHEYKRVPYLIFIPMVGYKVGKVIFEDVDVYEKEDDDVDVESVFVYYNEADNYIPIFVVKTTIFNRDRFAMTERSPTDEENLYCTIMLMRFVKMSTRQCPTIQERLSTVAVEDPPEMTINKVAYKVFKGAKYVGGSNYIGYAALARELMEVQGEEKQSQARASNSGGGV